jgi:hypothetical protein
MQSIADIRSMGKKALIPDEMETNDNGSEIEDVGLGMGDGGSEKEEIVEDFDVGIDNFLPFELRVIDSILESYVNLNREELQELEAKVKKFTDFRHRRTFSTQFLVTHFHIPTFIYVHFLAHID